LLFLFCLFDTTSFNQTDKTKFFNQIDEKNLPIAVNLSLVIFFILAFHFSNGST